MRDTTITKLHNDFKKYSSYMLFSARAILKAEVASSRLNWLWWILDPLFFMLVYMFVSLIVFKTSEPYFPVFVFIGISVWDFFNKTILQSVSLVRANNAIVSKIYIPKYILIFQKMCVNGFKMAISFSIVFIMMVFYRVNLTINIIYFVPLIVLLFIGTFSLSSIVMHFGVFVDDLTNVTNIVLRLIFYMSGIFYSIANRVPKPYSAILLNFNPVGFVINELRNCMLYGQTPDFAVMAIWFLSSILLSYVGIKIIYKYENGYVKVS